MVIGVESAAGSPVSGIVAVVPAFRPTAALPLLAKALAQAGVAGIILVDDGSGPQSQTIFLQAIAQPGVHLIRHAVNLGKGAALKSGLNEAICLFPGCLGVVTADADGQHAPWDVLTVAAHLAQHPDELVLGVRKFDRSVPTRSRLGNVITRLAVRLLLGTPVKDTQTGLRGIPRALIPHLLRIPSSGYEFELDMLVTAKHRGYSIGEEPVSTIYEPGNPSSHFNPLRDSMRIGFVLTRFSALSIVTAIVDNLAFVALQNLSFGIGLSQAGARLGAMLFNYGAARRAVFLSQENHRSTLPRYVLLVLASGVVSYGLIHALLAVTQLNPLRAKLLAETSLFLASFALQRDFVFTRSVPAEAATDWTRYYRSVPPTARLARRHTAKVLVDVLRRFAPRGPVTIAEYGGANSCFIDSLRRHIRPSAYHVIDTNRYGLELLRRKVNADPNVHLHEASVLTGLKMTPADVVFSVGLIEHFSPADTRRAVEAHFKLARPGGLVVLSFPTPTLLYRFTRAVCEMFAVWAFPDERPLGRPEVIAAIGNRGRVLYEKVLWRLLLTQRLMVIDVADTESRACISDTPATALDDSCLRS